MNSGTGALARSTPRAAPRHVRMATKAVDMSQHTQRVTAARPAVNVAAADNAPTSSTAAAVGRDNVGTALLELLERGTLKDAVLDANALHCIEDA